MWIENSVGMLYVHVQNVSLTTSWPQHVSGAFTRIHFVHVFMHLVIICALCVHVLFICFLPSILCTFEEPWEITGTIKGKLEWECEGKRGRPRETTSFSSSIWSRSQEQTHVLYMMFKRLYIDLLKWSWIPGQWSMALYVRRLHQELGLHISAQAQRGSVVIWPFLINWEMKVGACLRSCVP